MYRVAYGVMGYFVNLEAVEGGLLNSRLIEYPFVIQKLDGLRRGKVLDIGCADEGNVVAPILAALGWQVYGIDLRDWKFRHPNFHFVQGDIRRTQFADAFFDCAYDISSIEHVGLAGRYGVTHEDPAGDIKAIQEVARIVKPGGTFLLTKPYGTGGVLRAAERVYNKETLRKLLRGWSVAAVAYHRLGSQGIWHRVSEEEAARTRTPGGVCVALVETTR